MHFQLYSKKLKHLAQKITEKNRIIPPGTINRKRTKH